MRREAGQFVFAELSILRLIMLMFFVAQPELFRYGNDWQLMKRRMDAAKGISFPLADGQG